ncbi:fungal-specific transcription factor domain-containing protein [Aspergillus unguis]
MCLGYTAVKKMSVLKENEFNAAWAYLDNAMSVVPQLVFSSADAMGVQALLIMAVTYNSNMSFRASSMLLAMAVRLAFAKGFHRKPVGTFVPTEICRVRQNITWIAYVMDKGMCIRFGHPPLIDDDEIGIDLPAKETDAGVPSLLGHLVPLALIQSKICKWIYSPRYRTKPLEQRLRLMDELGDMLDAWKAGLPLQFQPENTPSDGPIGPVLNLHMIYYYTVASLHRASMGVCLEPQMEQAFQRASVDRAHRMEHSAQLCLSVSHATIDLLSYANGVLPQHYVTCWSVCFHVLVAALLLFVHTVNNPRRPEARSNLAYLQFFAQVIHSSPFTELSPVGKGLGALADLLVDICSSSVVSSHDILAVHGVDGADSVEAFSPPTTTTATSQELELGQPFTSQPPDQDHSDVGPSVEAASTIFDLFFQDPPDAGGSMPLSQSTNWYDGVLSLPLDQS